MSERDCHTWHRSVNVFTTKCSVSKVDLNIFLYSKVICSEIMFWVGQTASKLRLLFLRIPRTSLRQDLKLLLVPLCLNLSSPGPRSWPGQREGGTPLMHIVIIQSRTLMHPLTSHWKIGLTFSVLMTLPLWLANLRFVHLMSIVRLTTLCCPGFHIHSYMAGPLTTGFAAPLHILLQSHEGLFLPSLHTWFSLPAALTSLALFKTLTCFGILFLTGWCSSKQTVVNVLHPPCDWLFYICPYTSSSTLPSRHYHAPSL